MISLKSFLSISMTMMMISGVTTFHGSRIDGKMEA